MPTGVLVSSDRRTDRFWSARGKSTLQLPPSPFDACGRRRGRTESCRRSLPASRSGARGCRSRRAPRRNCAVASRCDQQGDDRRDARMRGAHAGVVYRQSGYHCGPMRVRFWGSAGRCRGRTPRSIGHGCNTPCIEVSDEQTGAFLILDAGSGIVGLGDALGARPRAVPILLTHYHWDHIAGPAVFRAVLPARLVAGDLGAGARDASTPSGWRRSSSRRSFPCRSTSCRRRPRSRSSSPGRLEIGGFRVTRAAADPSGRRVRLPRRTATTATWSTPPITSSATPTPTSGWRRSALNAAAIILDAHFTPEELPAHSGLGPRELAAGGGVRVGVRRRSALAVPPQAGADRRELAAIEDARAPRVSRATTAAQRRRVAFED